RLQQWCHGGTGRGFLVLDGDTGLNDRTVLRPDLQWFAAGRDIRAEERRSLPLGDLVVEVRSPSTWSRDIGIKRRLYEQHGAREYWLVDLIARSVIRLHRDTDATGLDDGVELTEDESLTTPLLPGFALPVADVFADPTADTT
ncbi:MAG: Uma2 family endonuclease, partial [Solirubrobacteraceae bacterium]